MTAERCQCGRPGPECALNTDERACHTCGEPIKECMGFCKAHDLAEVYAGERLPCEVRELCGLCGLLFHWGRDGPERNDDVRPEMFDNWPERVRAIWARKRDRPRGGLAERAHG